MPTIFSKKAKGLPDRNRVIIAVSFDPMIFENISERAQAHGVSFREEVRRLVDFALAKGA